MDRTRTLRLRREVLATLTPDEMGAVPGGNNQVVTEVGCRQTEQMLAVLRRALSLDASCRCITASGCTVP